VRKKLLLLICLQVVTAAPPIFEAIRAVETPEQIISKTFIL
jgi:hypothetical protein